MLRIFLFLTLVFLSFSPSVCFSESQNKQSDIQNTEGPFMWDFGQVKQGEILEHAFILKNELSQTLNIKGVNTSCGCTVSESEKKALLPREETFIKVRFNTKGYAGSVQQFVYVNTDDPDNPILKFTIKANVVK